MIGLDLLSFLFSLLACLRCVLKVRSIYRCFNFLFFYEDITPASSSQSSNSQVKKTNIEAKTMK